MNKDTLLINNINVKRALQNVNNVKMNLIIAYHVSHNLEENKNCHAFVSLVFMKIQKPSTAKNVQYNA